MLFLLLLATLDPINGDYFRELIEKHSNRIKSYAYGKVHNEQDAEEIVQDTFLKVYRYLEKFMGLPEDDVKRLLIAYTKTAIADYYRKKKTTIDTLDCYYDEEGNDIDFPDTSTSPETIIISEETCRRMASLIESLPQAQYEVMLLKYKYYHTDGEISKILGISEQAVSSRANRARNTLRKMLGGVLK